MSGASADYIGTPGLPGADLTGFGGVTGDIPTSLSENIDNSLLNAGLSDPFNPDTSLSLDNSPANTIDNEINNVAAGTPTVSNTGGLTDLFLRGVVIILGFIFVAVGLSMFRTPLIQKLTK